ncbi:glycosyltransferase family 4 protein [Paraburkholderia sp. D15]|uniref:glycosyltransferase family 4 protein n=1 Tax=Paraburkholderia sp. D15 TaxID=2880218 RepID=UPI002479E006|nr:glycosyltransferase family 4 protein [Paraburkholderia sp. D15]WGS53975.1 glycosyltransferase family 4 protein [Paraburkholderia sp. D15]
MKVLVVTNMYAARNPALPAQGVFVTEQVDALHALHGDPIDVFVIESWRGRLAYLKSLFSVTCLIRRHAYDVVHYHFGLSACSAPWVRLFSRAKVVITFHGSDVMGRGWMRRLSLAAARFAHACIGVSEPITDVVSGVSKRCSTIPCAVNEALFVPPKDRVESAPGPKIVVFPSSPDRPEKDYPLFREVVERLSASFGFDVEERHIDGLDRIGVRDLLARADCLVMTSRREGSPQAVKEAMAVNLPVIAVDVGDVRRLLDGVSHCAVIEGRDAAVLARATAQVLNDAQRSDGRRRLESLGYFSKAVAMQVDRVYRTALAGTGERRSKPHARTCVPTSPQPEHNPNRTRDETH